MVGMLRNLAAVAVVSVVGLGVGSDGASAAFDLTGGHYSGGNTGDHVITFSGYSVICQSATATGGTENGSSSASTAFVMDFASCDLAGFPANVSVTGPWVLSVVSMLSSVPSPKYAIEVRLPATSSVTVEIPLLGCEVYLTTPQSFQHFGGNVLTATDLVGSLAVEISIDGMSYTTNGFCPFGAGDDGRYEGTVDLDGVSVDVI